MAFLQLLDTCCSVHMDYMSLDMDWSNKDFPFPVAELELADILWMDPQFHLVCNYKSENDWILHIEHLYRTMIHMDRRIFDWRKQVLVHIPMIPHTLDGIEAVLQ